METKKQRSKIANGNSDRMGSKARSLALRLICVFLGGTLLGSLAPESGNILAMLLGLPSHIFNPLFLALGIIGIGCSFYFGYRKRK